MEKTEEEINCRYAAAFLEYKEELDAKHDKYERVVKLSRDTTILSKRIIFLLHRVSASKEQGRLLEEVEAKLGEVCEVLRLVAEELRGSDPYQYRAAYSPGLQEFIEALSFYTFLMRGELVSLEDVQHWLCFTEQREEEEEVEVEGEGGESGNGGSRKVTGGEEELTENSSSGDTEENIGGSDAEGRLSLWVPLSELNFVLGVADLTGELMRMCITAVGGGQQEVAFQLLPFIRAIHCGFHSIMPVSGEIGHKLRTLRSSLTKIEYACYTLKIRGSEIPRDMLGDVFRVPAEGENSNQYDSD